jgi:hypothetical protein
LAVVVTDAAAEGEFQFERRKFGTLASELKVLSEWLASQQVREAVMESTAQYWKPVWRQLEGQCQLRLAQAHSNRRRGDGSGIFRTRSAWSAGTWRANSFSVLCRTNNSACGAL